uniref:SPIN-DOC-like zinc-finger domain-containing protein n=1 Tax=Octopus bimaculoides TaxID=37653 RepID=A0A0L8GE70_OCTBM
MSSDTKKKRENSISYGQKNIETCNNIICLICNDKIAVCKEYNIKHHYAAKHESQYNELNGERRKMKIDELTHVLALDKNTDQSDTAQLVIFIRGIDINFYITEEMLNMCHMKDTTTGRDIIEHENLSLEKVDVDRNKINLITTDGASALTNIVNVVNFIRSRGLNHRTFKAYLVEVGSEYEDVIYFSKVRWLSQAATLNRFQLLLLKIKQFMQNKKQNVDFLANEEWLNDLTFLVDITEMLTELNLHLQGKN